jgi:hypothetical protein
MDLLGRPAADVRAACRRAENFHQPDDADLVDLDAGIAHGAYGVRQGEKVVADIRGIGSRHADIFKNDICEFESDEPRSRSP